MLVKPLLDEASNTSKVQDQLGSVGSQGILQGLNLASLASASEH